MFKNNINGDIKGLSVNTNVLGLKAKGFLIKDATYKYT